jgi:hypothetical protein
MVSCTSHSRVARTLPAASSIFSPKNGTLLKQLVHGVPLNQPWGLAIAPGNFGPFSNTVLVSNNLPAGTINAFHSVAGGFVGTLKDGNSEVIHINQL